MDGYKAMERRDGRSGRRLPSRTSPGQINGGMKDKTLEARLNGFREAKELKGKGSQLSVALNITRLAKERGLPLYAVIV
jgi:hypothetical protein